MMKRKSNSRTHAADQQAALASAGMAARLAPRITCIAGLLLGAVLVFTATLTTFAEVRDEDAYTYTVTIYAGAQGEFEDGSGTYVMEGVKPGTRITISEESTGFTLTNKEYYVRGFREAGHDAGLGKDEVGSPTFVVNEDCAYEVAYGLAGGMVSYTVRYEDEDGNSLHAADTYYGMPNDKPVVSYQYVEGYQPNAYNATKTLSENEAENVFTFTYSKIGGSADGEAADGEDGDSTDSGNSDGGNGGNSGNTDGNANDGASGTWNANGAADGSNANGDASGSDGAADADGQNASGDNAGPVELVDLDDGDTPLAESAGASEESGASNKTVGLAIAGGAGALLLAILAFLLARRRKENEDL